MKEIRKTKTIRMIVLLLALSAMLVGCSSGDSSMIASVNGEKITEAELNETLTAQYGVEVLDKLITEKIIELEAEKLDVSVTEEEIEAEYEVYTTQYGDEEAFLEVLSSYNMDVEDLKEDIKEYLLTLKLMEDYVGITDEEVKIYFDENKATYGQEAQVEASHILVEDEKKAQEVIGKLDNGEDFAELAKEYSIDTATQEDGGNLGYFGKGEMEETFENKAFSMEIDSISEPVETDYGFHIIKVTDKIEEKEAGFEDVKDTVYQDLLSSKVNELYSTWLAEKLEEYDIKNKLTN